jgi:putative MATE family efflux protein
MSSPLSLTEGPLARQILRFSLPLVLSNLLQVLFNMSDLAVVGRFAGATALGAVGSTSIFVTLFTSFLIGLAGGVNVLVARYYGARHERDVRETVHSAALVCALVGLLLLVAGLALSRPLLVLLGTKPTLLAGAALYLRIYFLGMPALALYNFGNAVFSAVGETRKPLYYLSAAGALNVALNLLFVVGFRLDVAGVAAASVIAQYLSAGLILAALARSEGCYALRRAQLRLTPAKTRTILALGIPAGCQTAIFYVANLFIQASVNSFDTVMVEGNAAAANADSLVYDAMAAFYTACSSFMGQNYGAGKPRRVKKSYFISLAYAFAVGAVLGLGLVACSRSFLALFTTDAAVIEAGRQRLLIMGCSYAFSAFMDCTIAASRGLGKTVVPTILVFLGSCVFRVIWIYTIFAHFHTIPSLYLLFIASWSVTAAAELVYFVKIYKTQMAIFRSDAAA